MDLDHAIKAHVEWKAKLRGAISAQSQMDAISAGKDNACEFGKWLHGEGQSKYSKFKTFSECVTAHAAFHREAGKVAQLINEKKYTQAEAALSGNSPFNAASGTTGVAITRLKKDAGL